MKLDLSAFERALAALDKGLARAQGSPGDEELRDACIQRFEFTFELAWRFLKRRLASDLPNVEDLDSMSFRTLVRVGAEQGLIDDPTAWFLYCEKRNLTSHTYDAEKAADVFAVLPEFAGHARDLLARIRERGREDAGADG